jgi:hypothetical protein
VCVCVCVCDQMLAEDLRSREAEYARDLKADAEAAAELTDTLHELERALLERTKGVCVCVCVCVSVLLCC